jgi:hypothetical protein
MAYPDAPNTGPIGTPGTILFTMGANSQEQAWSRNVIAGQLIKNPYTRLSSGGMMGGKPIQTYSEGKNLRGQTVNITVEAPLGGPGVQGAGAARSGNGENIKRYVFSVGFGNHWNGISQNNITAAQTVMGFGSFDLGVRDKLKPWFAQAHAWMTQAELRANAATNAARLRLWGGGRISTAQLGGADTADQNLFRRISEKLTENQAMPFAVAKKNNQEIEKFLILAPSKSLEDLNATGAWQTLLSQSGLRGSDNYLFTGEMPEWAGSCIVPWQVQNTTADGPQGSFSSPVAFLGETIAAGTAAFTVKGGSNANGAALTNRLYFQFFPAAEFKMFEQTKIAATTGTPYFLLSRDIATGKFAFMSYTTTNGNTITGLGKLASNNTGPNETTLGGITFNSNSNAVSTAWKDKLLDMATEDLTVGSPIWPCNAKGQCFVDIEAMGQHAFTQGWGAIDGIVGGRRTINNDDDHQRFAEIGFEEQWGINGVRDANGLFNSIVQTTVAWNPDGAPTDIPSL